MKTWLKTELHSHTIDDPKDGKSIVVHSAQQLIDQAEEQGFQVLSITNHNQLLFSSSLEEYARERGILLIPGTEATLEKKHVLLYNFLDYENSWKTPGIVAQHKGSNQLVIAPHPFFPIPTALGKRVTRWGGLFDALEYSQFYFSWLNFNERAKEVAGQLDLPVVGNTDLHWLFQLGWTYSLVYAEQNTDSVIHAIKEGHVRLVTQPVSPLFLARWCGLNVLTKSHHASQAALSRVQQRLGRRAN